MLHTHTHSHTHTLTHTHTHSHTHSLSSSVLFMGHKRLCFRMAHKIFQHIQCSDILDSWRFHLLSASFCTQHYLSYLHASLEWRESLHTTTQVGHIWCLVVLYTGTRLNLLHRTLLHHQTHGGLLLSVHVFLCICPLLLDGCGLQEETCFGPHTPICMSNTDLPSQTELFVPLKYSPCDILLCDGPGFGCWGCHQCLAHT